MSENGTLCAHTRISRVGSLTECKKAATKLKKSDDEIMFYMTETELRWPKGCYVQQHTKYVYWNAHGTGSANILARHICRGKGIKLKCTFYT